MDKRIVYIDEEWYMKNDIWFALINDWTTHDLFIFIEIASHSVYR